MIRVTIYDDDFPGVLKEIAISKNVRIGNAKDKILAKKVAMETMWKTLHEAWLERNTREFI